MCHYFINFSSCNNKFHLVIIVMTVIDQVPPEQMLRQTWMQIASLGGKSKKQSENWGSETRKDANEQAIEGCSHRVLTSQQFEAALFKAEKTPTAGGSSQVKICRSFCSWKFWGRVYELEVLRLCGQDPRASGTIIMWYLIMLLCHCFSICFEKHRFNCPSFRKKSVSVTSMWNLE